MVRCTADGGGSQGCHPLVQDIRDLIKRLLTHNPTQRLGSGKGGAADVKAHPWFTSFDWAAFAKRHLKAPYEPQARNNTFFAIIGNTWPEVCMVHLCSHAEGCADAVLILLCMPMQIAHAEDVRNFSGGAEEPHAAGKGKRYVSTGIFRDF